MIGCKGDLFELVFRFEERIGGTEFFFFFTFIYLVTLYLFVRLYLIFFLSKSIFFLRVVE